MLCGHLQRRSAATRSLGELWLDELRRKTLLDNWVNRREDIRKADGLTSPSLRAKVLRLRASLRPSVVATREQETGESAQPQSRREASRCGFVGGAEGTMVGYLRARAEVQVIVLD